MSRSSLTGRLTTALTAASALAIAACSDVPVQPDAAAPAPTSPSLSKAPAEDEVVAGEVIVKLKDNASVDAVTRRHGLAKGRTGYAKAYDILVTGKGNERAIAARLARDPDVEYAEPNYIRHVDAIDARLWAFYNPGGLNMSFYNDPNGRTGPLPSTYASIKDADEDNIAGYAATGQNVQIGSIDTGVDFAHPEFTGRLIAGKDWYSNDGNTPYDTPDEGHGTHTTGTMAGTNVGVAGVAGAASHVKVYVQRVCGANGCPTSAIINAINAAVDYKIAGNPLVAVNMSLGGNSESTGEKTAIARAMQNGVLVIASAGNSGSGKVACPACDPNAVSVASTTWRDELAPYSQSGSGLDLSAPGGSCYSNTTENGCIFSAVATGYTGGRTYTLGGKGPYAYMQGTSMAAPQVTGTAAIVASVTGLRGAALRDRLYHTADDLGAKGYDTKFGNGRINSYRAVKGTSLGTGL